jgi:hypothetical protein
MISKFITYLLLSFFSLGRAEKLVEIYDTFRASIGNIELAQHKIHSFPYIAEVRVNHL